jgi:FkbM family methyltransferase
MDFLKNIPNIDLWSYLCATDKTVVMYGMGNGADKILNVCQQYNIEIADFFASDGFVRGHSFHGKTVLSYTQIKEKYGADNIIVLLSFGSSLPDVLSLFKRVNEECEMYAPDVPVCGENIFTLDFFNENKEKILAVRSLLADNISRRIYDNVIFYKLTGKLDYLFNAECDRKDTFKLIDAQSIKSFADLGAYRGDTLAEMLEYAPNLKYAYAFEPDARTFKKLSAFCDAYEGEAELYPLNVAAWSDEDTLIFNSSSNRNSGAFAPVTNAKTVEIAANSLDNVLNGKSIDHIKYDVEGAEKQALEGSTQTIKAFTPSLCVSAYHRSEDIFALPLQIKAITPNYKLYLRRYPYVPAWDIELICVVK